MMQKIQRFGAAMFTPVLLFAFAGITVGLCILFKNPDIVGPIANEGTLWYQIWTLIEEGGWTVFRQLPLLFVVGLPIALAKKAQARACMEALVTYLTFNYFVNSMLTQWGSFFGVDFAQEVGGVSGLTTIAGIKTFDTGMIGAILIAGIAVWIHNRFFDTELPEYLGIFRGSSFVVMIGFFVMIPTAFVVCLVWPAVQNGINSLQGFLASSGIVGVWIYTFLERILIPTGIATYWPQHLAQYAMSQQSLTELFPAGGFALHGHSKIFGSVGIALALYMTAKPNKKKIVAGLLIPATLTAILAGITEPLEFTFLFVAPILFVVHAILAATLAAAEFAFGVSGNFGGGIIEWAAQNWIPLAKNHWQTYLIQIAIGLCFTAIYFIVFRFVILKMNLKTPGREDDDEETKLYTKADYKAKKGEESIKEDKSGKSKTAKKAEGILEALGGKENIVDVTNCATRLRLTVKDESKLAADSVFKSAGALGVVRNGKAIQVIIGLSVSQVREEFEQLL